MSVTGTIIIPAGRDFTASDGSQVEFKYAVGNIRFNHLANPASSSGTPQVLRCPESDLNSCYRPQLVAASGVDSLYSHVNNSVNNIVNYIKSGSALTDTELKLIGMVKLPVFALMQAAADVSEGTLVAVAETVKELAATELAATLIEDTVSLGLQAIAASPSSSKDENKELFASHAENVLSEAREARALAHAKFGGVHEVMRQTNYWRAQAMNKFAPHLHQRIALARALSVQR